MPVFRPSMVVNIKLMFDPKLTLAAEPLAVPVSALIEKPTPGGTQAPGGDEPLITKLGEENVSFIMARIPKTASVELPGYRQAATFSLSFDYADCPIDPRAIRAGAVEIHLGTITDGQAAEGYTQRNADGSVASVLRTRDTTGAGKKSAITSTLLMVGMIDEWHVVHGSSGSHIEMKGRDLRGVLIDTSIEVVPGATTDLMAHLDLERPVNDVVMQILSYNPLFERINVIVNPAEWAGDTVPTVAAKAYVPRHRVGAKGKAKPKNTPPTTAGKCSFWDLIVRVCYLVGGIPYFRGTDLFIRPSRTIYDQARGDVDPVKNPTPFAGGRLRTFDQIAKAVINPGLKWRRLVYGRDIEQLSFNRKYGGNHRPQIVRCISIDTSETADGAGYIVEGVWPPIDYKERGPKSKAYKEKVSKSSYKELAGSKSAAGGSKAVEEILNVPVAGVNSETVLTEIARSLYEEIGRGEIGGQVSTTNLASFGGDNLDPDMLGLRPGDGVEFLVDTRAIGDGPPLISTYTDAMRKSFSAAVKDVEDRIGDTNLARVIVATARGRVLELQRFFRVQTVKFAWSDKGVKIDFDFQNYFVPRNQVSLASQTSGEVKVIATPSTATTSLYKPGTGAGAHRAKEPFAPPAAPPPSPAPRGYTPSAPPPPKAPSATPAGRPTFSIFKK